jgi:CheY-like chemotaxis protein
LRDVIEESLELLAVRAAEREVELGAVIAHDLPRCLRGDPNRLRQILLNLNGNAVKFTEKGFVTVSLKQEPTPDSTLRIRIEIRDTGIGIDETTQKELFQPFTQADNSTTRRFGGTGLGLAISQQIVGLMGGTIGVESTPGRGSTFWFSLPFSPCVEQGSSPSTSSDLGGFAKLNLLLVGLSSLSEEVLHHHAGPWNIRLESCPSVNDLHDQLLRNATSERKYSAVVIGLQDFRTARQNGYLHLDPSGAHLMPAIVLAPWQSIATQKGSLPSPAISLVQIPIRRRSLLRAFQEALGPECGSRHPFSNTEPASPSSENVNDLPPLHILVAEDNAVNQRVIQLQLRRLGYEPIIVKDGVDALRALNRRRYDLVLMDCQMPEMDGYVATQKLRQDPATRDVYVIAMTANSLEGDRERCIAAGMNHYLAKPTRPAELIAALRLAAANKSSLKTG